MKSILDHSFRYTSSIETDLRKTFARLRRQKQDDQKAAQRTGRQGNVLAMNVERMAK
jgi:hypothetical protein